MTEKKEKNIAKGELYTLAFTRIESAIESQFSLEAIAIEESIIADRLRSILSKAIPVVVNQQKNFELSGLLNLIQAYIAPRADRLWVDVQAWACKRNQLIHGIVATRSGAKAKLPAKRFVSEAMAAAKKGFNLAHQVSHWVDREARVVKRRRESQPETPPVK